MELDNYFKGSKPLNEREEYLFKLIDKLDKESFDLFSEIIDLKEESYYKLERLFEKGIELYDLYNSVSDGFDYLNNIEINSYSFAYRRFQLNNFLSIFVSINIIMLNIIAGILAFVILSKQNNKQFADEVGNLSLKINKFDEDRLELIRRTLDNSANILKAKTNKANELINDSNNSELKKSNYFIYNYIKGNTNNEDIKCLPLEVKNRIISILKRDLDIETNDILELLDKTKENNEVKLIKKI